MQAPRIGRLVLTDETQLRKYSALMRLQCALGALEILAGALLLLWVPGTAPMAVVAGLVGFWTLGFGLRNALRTSEALRSLPD